MTLHRIFIVLLVAAGAGVQARAQSDSRASHKVTIERIAETRVTGPMRIALRPQAVRNEPARLQLVSSVPRLKVVYSLLEPAEDVSASTEPAVEPLTADMREVYSSEEWVEPATVQQIDLTRVVESLPAERTPDQRLVVTITE